MSCHNKHYYGNSGKTLMRQRASVLCVHYSAMNSKWCHIVPYQQTYY